jgi:hypothetical protein
MEQKPLITFRPFASMEFQGYINNENKFVATTSIILGSTFRGNFDDKGLLHGQGSIERVAEGILYKGEFDHGRLVNGQKFVNGVLTEEGEYAFTSESKTPVLKSGTKYLESNLTLKKQTGDFNPFGYLTNGTYICDGRIYKGEFNISLIAGEIVDLSTRMNGFFRRFIDRCRSVFSIDYIRNSMDHSMEPSNVYMWKGTMTKTINDSSFIAAYELNENDQLVQCEVIYDGNFNSLSSVEQALYIASECNKGSYGVNMIDISNYFNSHYDSRVVIEPKLFVKITDFKYGYKISNDINVEMIEMKRCKSCKSCGLVQKN